MKRILCCWFPNWPIQRAVIDQPDLRGQPLALYESGPRGGLRIATVSSTAARLGIEPGIPMADATARLGKKLHVLLADPITDHKRLLQLARRCERFSPLVGVNRAEDGWKNQGAQDIEGSDSLLLNLTGIGRLFGSEEKLLQQIEAAIQAWGYRARMAIAPTVGAAWAFSHFDVRCHQGALQLDQSELTQLQTLPLAALRLPENMLQELFELGLERIGDLMGLPRDSVSARFPDVLLKRLDQALGQQPESFQTIEPLEEFIATWDFFYPTHKDAAINTVLGHLCDRLADRLQAANRGALEVACHITCEPKSKQVQTMRFYRETSNPKHLFDLLQLKFEQVRLPSPVASLSLNATRTSRMLARQKELFTDDWKDYSEEFSLLVNQLSGRLGENQVVRPLLCAHAQPERAYREEPLLIATRKRGSAMSPFAVLERPIQLFQRPIAIEVTAKYPDGPPRQFVWSGQSYQVHRHQGPERIETNWWGKRGIRRDYYRVETQNGAWYWLFRNLDHGQWFLHGKFG